MRTHLQIALSVLAVLLLAACPAQADPTLTPFVARHAIFINDLGEPVTMENGKRPALSATAYSAYLDSLIESLERSGRKRILLRVHGGLNQLKKNVETSERFSREIETTSDFYPIFINWECGFGSSITEHLIGPREHRLQAMWTDAPVPFVGPLYRTTSGLVSGALALPLRSFWARQRNEAIAATYERHGANGFVGRRILGVETATEDSIRAKSRLGKLTRSRSSRWTQLVSPIRGLVNGGQTMMEMFIVRGFGPGTYDAMRRRTDLMFYTEATRRYRTRSLFLMRFKQGAAGKGALALLLDRLDQLCAKDPAYEITLVGHSMGAIVASKILAYDPNLPVSTIVFMAGASTLTDYRTMVVPYLLSHPKTRLYNLTLHRLGDLAENGLAWTLVFKYQGSLLAWIDDVLSTPLTTRDRTMGRADNLDDLDRITPFGVLDRVYLREFDYPTAGFGDRERMPGRHGEFSRPGVPFWREDFWWPEHRAGQIESPVSSP